MSGGFADITGITARTCKLINILSIVKPLFNKPLCNKALSMTNGILQHGQSYSKTIQKPKHIIYPNITKKCQHVTKDKYETDQQG